MKERGQAYTIEGLIGAVLIASALVVGLQAVDISPWTDDTDDPRLDSIRVQVQDLLAAASDRGALRTAVTCVDGDGDGEPHPAVTAGGASNDTDRAAFGTLLNRTLDANDYRYKVTVEHNASAGGSVNATRLTPERDVTRSSVTVTRHLVLFDSDRIHEFDADRGECVPVRAGNNTLGQRDPADVYIEDQSPDSDVYAVVKVRVVAW